MLLLLWNGNYFMASMSFKVALLLMVLSNIAPFCLMSEAWISPLRMHILFGGQKVKHLRTNNDLIFWKSQLVKFYQRSGTVRHRNICNTPRWYGMAEHLSLPLLKRACCMFFHAILGKFFWNKAYNACYWVNLSS